MKILFFLLSMPGYCLAQASLYHVAFYTRTDFLHRAGILGNEMSMIVYDRGVPREDHIEYKKNIIVERFPMNTVPNLNASFVAGILFSEGITRSVYRGIAPLAKGHFRPIQRGLNHDLYGDLLAFKGKTVIANYIIESNVNLTPLAYGRYSQNSLVIDESAYKNNYFLAVAPAGEIYPAPFADYDQLIPSGVGTAKNSLTVGNAANVTINSFGYFVSGQIDPYSSIGPTLDRRIKPEIAGFGTDVISCSATSATGFQSGTNAIYACANVSGSLLLLTEYYQKKFGKKEYMRAATLKGLALHTADLMHTTPGSVGPDTKSGWGLLNSKFAKEAIDGRWVSSLIDELELTAGDKYSIEVPSNGLTPLQVSISWTDPPGNTEIEKTLVNDLDLKVTRLLTKTAPEKDFYPYALNGRGIAEINENKADPFERVDINTPLPGKYRISVTHRGAVLKDGKQKFSLIVTGMGEDEEEAKKACEKNIRIPVAIAGSASIIAHSISTELEITSDQQSEEEQDEDSDDDVWFDATDQINLENGTYVHDVDFCGRIGPCNPAESSASSALNTRQNSMVVDSVAADYFASFAKSELQLYPNPAGDYISIRSGKKGIRRMQLFSIDGQLRLDKTFSNQKYVQLYTGNLRSGSYVVLVLKEDGVSEKIKLIKK